MDSIIITSKGDVKRIVPSNGKDFSLYELQEMVGGYIEIVQFMKDAGWFCFSMEDGGVIDMDMTDEYVMVINEEGKLLTPEYNYLASVVAEKTDSMLPGDWIAGNAVICPSKMIK